MKSCLLFLMLCLVGALMLVAGGCGLTEGDQASAVSPDGTQPASLGRYHDFDDIQVPNSLSLVRDESNFFRVGTFKAGVLVYKDRVEVESLINFFLESMAKDNWTLKGTFKYPRAALFFAKQGKTCVIRVEEGTISTKVEIWVAPTL